MCEHKRMHMLVIYIEYQGLFMFGLESPKTDEKKKKSARHIRVCFPQLSLRPQCQWHIFKTTF